jgi:hypothetical protein
MDRAEEITAAINELSLEEFRRIVQWLRELEETR